jgi:succinyl-CoA synthetase alpha subunit
MMDYANTQVVAGVKPGAGGTTTERGVPVFDSVAEAVEKTGANAHFVIVPPRFAADTIIEGAAAGVDVIVCVTEFIPIQEMVSAVRYVKSTNKTRLIGPNCPGLLSVNKCKIGFMPAVSFSSGPVGFVSRSGTLTYEIIDSLTRANLGQTTAVGIGGDPILGMTFADVLPLFEADPETKVVVLVGEIGGSDEEIAAEYIKNTMAKPVVGFIAAGPLRPANAWVTRARSFPARRAARKARWTPSRRPACPSPTRLLTSLAWSSRRWRGYFNSHRKNSPARLSPPGCFRFVWSGGSATTRQQTGRPG